MHGSQKCCGELVELTVDDIWQIAEGPEGEEQDGRTGKRKTGSSTPQIYSRSDAYNVVYAKSEQYHSTLR